MIAIDPGLRGCGVAAFNHLVPDKRLVYATWVQNPIVIGRGPHVWRPMADAVFKELKHLPAPYLSKVCVEMPKVYPGMPKTDINDLLDLAGVLGAIVSHPWALGVVEWFYPQDWKGQVPKATMNARVKERLTAEERQAIFSVGAKDHNTLDAIGIGLHSLGRLERKRVYG